MSLIETILSMYYDEYLTIGEIASALRQDPNYIYDVVFRR